MLTTENEKKGAFSNELSSSFVDYPEVAEALLCLHARSDHTQATILESKTCEFEVRNDWSRWNSSYWTCICGPCRPPQKLVEQLVNSGTGSPDPPPPPPNCCSYRHACEHADCMEDSMQSTFPVTHGMHSVVASVSVTETSLIICFLHYLVCSGSWNFQLQHRCSFTICRWGNHCKLLCNWKPRTSHQNQWTSRAGVVSIHRHSIRRMCGSEHHCVWQPCRKQPHYHLPRDTQSGCYLPWGK